MNTLKNLRQSGRRYAAHLLLPIIILTSGEGLAGNQVLRVDPDGKVMIKTGLTPELLGRQRVCVFLDDKPVGCGPVDHFAEGRLTLRLKPPTVTLKPMDRVTLTRPNPANPLPLGLPPERVGSHDAN